MEIKKDFVLREIAGDYVLVPVGKTVGEYSGLFPITETGAAIWKLLPEANDGEYIAEKLFSEYDADKDVIREDVDTFLKKLADYGII